MTAARIAATSSWDFTRIEQFLTEYIAPLRVAVIGSQGYPVICSLWTEYREGKLMCATQRDALIAKILWKSPRAGFELAPNEPPYFGVRGYGDVEIQQEDAVALLERLMDRYLGDGQLKLRRQLLDNAETEVALVISPRFLTAWDFRHRMTD